MCSAAQILITSILISNQIKHRYGLDTTSRLMHATNYKRYGSSEQLFFPLSVVISST